MNKAYGAAAHTLERCKLQRIKVAKGRLPYRRIMLPTWGGGKMLIINVLRVFMLIFMQQIYEEFFNYANKFWRVRPFVGVRDAN